MKSNYRKTLLILLMCILVLVVSYVGYLTMTADKTPYINNQQRKTIQNDSQSETGTKYTVTPESKITDVFYGKVSSSSKKDQGQLLKVQIGKNSYYPQVGNAQGEVTVYDPTNKYLPNKISPAPSYIFSTSYDAESNYYVLVEIKKPAYHPTGEQ